MSRKSHDPILTKFFVQYNQCLRPGKVTPHVRFTAVSLRFILIICLAFAMSDSQAQSNNEGIYRLDSLVTTLQASNNSWLPFLTVPTLRTGLYRLERGAQDKQSPHDRDEVYYVIEGSARMRIHETEHAIRPGDVIFVKAASPHRFFAIEEDLLLLVFFTEAVE